MNLIKDSATILFIYFLLYSEALNSRMEWNNILNDIANINKNLFHYYFSYAFLFPKTPVCNFRWLITWLYSGIIIVSSVSHRQHKKKSTENIHEVKCNTYSIKWDYLYKHVIF